MAVASLPGKEPGCSKPGLDGVDHLFHGGVRRGKPDPGCIHAVGGLASLLQAINLYIGVSAAPGEWPWTYIMLAILGLIFMAIPAGRILGLDGWLRRPLQVDAQRGNRLAKILLSLT